MRVISFSVNSRISPTDLTLPCTDPQNIEKSWKISLMRPKTSNAERNSPPDE